MYKCQECGRKFRTTQSADRASMSGCPGCGGVDIDLDDGKPAPPRKAPPLPKKEPTNKDFWDFLSGAG